MKLINDCPLCNKNQLDCIYELDYHHPGNEIESNLLDIHYVRLWILFEHILPKQTSLKAKFNICKNCGFIFINPRMEGKDIKVKYEIINKLGSVKKRQSILPDEAPKRRAFIYKSIKNYKKNQLKGLNILDFGGANGYNLCFFKENNKCFIVDYEKWILPEGIEYLCPTINDIPENIRFDIIISSATFEHLINPKEILKKLSMHLTPKGILYVEVPYECQKNWFEIWKNPITHINFFSSASLSYLMSTCGLREKWNCGPWKYFFNTGQFLVSIIAEQDSGEILTSKNGTGYEATKRQMHNPLFYSYRLAKNIKKKISK